MLNSPMMTRSHSGKKRSRDTPLNGTIIESADYLMDMEVKNQKKRKVGVDAEDSRWDERYLSFLVDLEDYCEAKFVDEDGDEDEDEDDEEDPIYAMFLGNLKEHGNCYMLDVSVEHGIRSPILYEVEADTPVLAKRRFLRTCRGNSFRRERRPDVDKKLKSRLKDFSSADKVKNRAPDTIKKLTHRARQGTYFLRNMNVKGSLKSGRKSSGLASKVQTGPSNVIKMGTSRTRQGNISRKERSMGAARPLKSVLQDSGFVNEVESDPSDLIKRKTSKTFQYSNIQKKGSLQADGMVASGQNKGVQEKRAQEADETYNSYLSGLKVIGDSVVYEFGDHEQIFYEGNVQKMSADDATKAAESPPRPPTHPPTLPNNCSAPPQPTPSSTEPINTPTPLSPKATHNTLNTSLTDKTLHSNGKDFQKEHDKIWSQLRKVLGKPFDQNEFVDLWKAMTFRSPVQSYRDSRSGGTYKLGDMGDSYLDMYPELNDEIEKVKSDSSKVLKLLRMLSFYLKKLPHGIPRPWLPDYRKMFLP